MIQKVSLYFVLPMCILALFLASLGVTHIGFGNDYYNFIQGVGNTFHSWSFSIPDIPKVPNIYETDFDDKGAILKVLINIANFLVKFVNVIISILNIFILLINVVIQVIQFILSLIFECRYFINRFRSSAIAYV